MFCDGYVTFEGIDCIYIIENESIKLFAADGNDVAKLNNHFADQNFLFRFSDNEFTNCMAYIDRTEINIGYAFSLIPIFILKLLNREPITTMEITGPAIDEIFHPASYYFFKAKSEKTNNIDLTHKYELADKWNITVDGLAVNISLQYGGILERGIASDMMLHPKLVASFSPTTECGFLFKVYSAITRFLQLTQYNSNFGECKVHLYGHILEHNSGYLYDCKRIGSARSFYNEIEYRYIKPYIEKLLQFSADNLNISLDFLPDATYRWNRTDYTPEILRSLFAAFESEYKKNEEIYEKDAGEDLSQIKDSIIRMIGEYPTEGLSDGEKNFIKQAKNRIHDIGNQPGQTRKMKNVINELRPVLNRCAEYLFLRSQIGSNEGFNSSEIKQIVDKIVGMRSLASHAYTLEKFDDIQAEYIHFLEILVHAQMLKRAGIDDEGIVLIVGILFHCNLAHTELLRKWIED